jgi:hypothetical protein
MTDRERERREVQRVASIAENGQRYASSERSFCTRHNVSRSTLNREKKLGRLKVSKIGRKNVIFDVDEDAWIEAVRNGATATAA